MPVPRPDDLPEYAPNPTIGDRLALTRAESHALEAERILAKPQGSVYGDALSNAAARQATLSRATAHAQAAQAWAFIAMTYQGPGDGASPWDGPLGDEPVKLCTCQGADWQPTSTGNCATCGRPTAAR